MRPEDQVVSLRVARALRKAGWPQDPWHNCFYYRAVNFQETSWRVVSPHMIIDRAFRPKIAAPTAAELGPSLPGEIYIPFKNGKRRKNPHHLVIQRRLVDTAWNVKYVCRSREWLRMRGQNVADAQARMWIALRKRNLLPV